MMAQDRSVQAPAAAEKVTGSRGRFVGPKPPPPSRPSLFHPPDSVRTQRPIHDPPKREGDAGSHLRSRRRAARRRLGCAGEAEASTATAERHLEFTTRLPAGASPLQPSPHPPLPQYFAPEPRVAARCRGGPWVGRSAPRGRIRALASLIGICLSNGTTDTPVVL